MSDRPNVTATEVAQWVFCRRAWLLDRQGEAVSDQAAVRMAAGEEFQAYSDANAREALYAQARSKSASR